MDEEELLGNSSDDENTIQETPQRDSPVTFSKYLVNRFGIIGHHNVSSETINPPDNQTLFKVKLVGSLTLSTMPQDRKQNRFLHRYRHYHR